MLLDRTATRGTSPWSNVGPPLVDRHPSVLHRSGCHPGLPDPLSEASSPCRMDPEPYGKVTLGCWSHWHIWYHLRLSHSPCSYTLFWETSWSASRGPWPNLALVAGRPFPTRCPDRRPPSSLPPWARRGCTWGRCTTPWAPRTTEGYRHPGHPGSHHPTTVTDHRHPSIRPMTYLIVWNYLPFRPGITKLASRSTLHDGQQPDRTPMFQVLDWPDCPELHGMYQRWTGTPPTTSVRTPHVSGTDCARLSVSARIEQSLVDVRQATAGGVRQVAMRIKRAFCSELYGLTSYWRLATVYHR